MHPCFPPEPGSDLDLMRAVARKDPRAQRLVVERLAHRVRRLTRLICRAAADAEDASQLALIEVLRSAELFRFDVSLEHWSDRIAARTALQVNRRERSRAELLARWLTPGKLPWGSAAISNHGARIDLERFLPQLSETRREAFVLRHALGFSVDEIAELTGAAPGTVKDRLVRARKQLRRLLEREASRVDEVGR